MHAECSCDVPSDVIVNKSGSAGSAPHSRGVPDMERLEKELSKNPAQEPNDATALTREQQEKLNQHKVLVGCM